MAHMIDTTTGQAAIAYAGQTPWHGLGQALAVGASIEEWTKQAGLAWEAMRAPVQFYGMGAGEVVPSIMTVPDRDVLYRSDTAGALGVVSRDYKVVQPAQVMEFFSQLTELGGFQMETAGALNDGKRIWALARINDGAPILPGGDDLVRPYLLLSTSFDGSLATVAKLTTIRVVCNNTLSASLHAEGDRTDTPIKTMVKVPHLATFDPQSVRKELGVFADNFEKWMLQTRQMAEHEISLDDAGSLTAKLIGADVPDAHGRMVDLARSKTYQRIMALFDGEAIGFDQAGHTKWNWLNSVTQWVDHERGRSQDRRLNAAWFGDGDSIKNAAYELALA